MRGQVKKTDRNDHSCLCEKNHSFVRCFHLNPSMQKPHRFKRNPAIRGQINRALQADDTKRKVNNQLNRIERSNQNTDDSPTLVVSLSALERENESELALPALLISKPQPTNPLFSSWIVDTAGGLHICNESMRGRLTNRKNGARRDPGSYSVKPHRAFLICHSPFASFWSVLLEEIDVTLVLIGLAWFGLGM